MRAFYICGTTDYYYKFENDVFYFWHHGEWNPVSHGRSYTLEDIQQMNFKEVPESAVMLEML